MAVTTTASFHLITDIKAIDHNGFGKPLTLRMDSRYGGTELTFFFEDETLTKRLVEAINGAVKATKPPQMGRAAYDAMVASETEAYNRRSR